MYLYIDGVQVRKYSNPIEYDFEKEEKEESNYSMLTIEEREEKILQNSMNRTTQKILGITRANKWDYFITFTFNGLNVDRSDLKEISKKTRKWLNNQKNRKASDLKYILVPELHADGINWHLHGLLANIGTIQLEDSTKIDRAGNTIYNVIDWEMGYSTVTKVLNNDGVSYYIIKYITKQICKLTKNRKRYWSSKNCLRLEDVEQKEFEDKITLDEFLYINSDRIRSVNTKDSLFSTTKTSYIELEHEKA